MKMKSAWIAVALVAALALSGCGGKSETGNGGGSGNGGEADPSTFAAGEKFDKGVGNTGFRIADGAATALAGGAILVEVVDNEAFTGGITEDLATIVLEAEHADGAKVTAQLRQLWTADGSFAGGAAQNEGVYTSTSDYPWPAGLPSAQGFIIASGLARVQIDGAAVGDVHPISVAVSEGIRADADQAALSAADNTDLELHVYLPGSDMAGGAALGQFSSLHYYFESVSIEKLSDADKSQVGKTLIKPDAPNVPPNAAGTTLVDGEPASEGLREGGDNFTVTFDGSASGDPDGEIMAWVWSIFELNSTGQYEAAPSTPLTGVTADYNFTKPGEKLIQLVVRDDRGGIDNFTMLFWVNQHRTDGRPDSVHLDTVTGGTACEPTVNCFSHFSSFESGAQKARYEVDTAGSQVADGVHIELFLPSQDPENDTPVATQEDALEVEADVLTEAGRYTVRVWFEAGAAVEYTVDMLITYSPQVPA